MGHFAGSPSARLVTACLATHGKQNAWPHSVTCGAVIRSSRHTGQRSGSAAPNSTSTTSSQSTMWSGSRLLPARSAQSATRNRKLACRKSSLECAPRRAREDGAPRPPPRPPPFRPPPFRPLMNGPPRRGASVSRAGARKFNRKSARTPLPPRLGGAASVDPGRGEDASPSRDARSRAEVDGPLPALGPGGLAPPRPEPTLRLPLLRPPLPPPPPRAPLPRLARASARGSRGRLPAFGPARTPRERREERRGVEVQPADSPSGVVRHGDAPRIDPRASTDAPHADVAGKPRGYYDAKGEVTSLRVGTSEHRYHV